MFINEIFFGVFTGGLVNGSVGFQIEFTGEDATDAEIADVIIAIRRHEKGLAKGICFTGEFTNENSTAIITLLRSLKDTGYKVIARTTGRKYHLWFKQLDYLIAITSDPEWLGFDVSEIWYNPPSDEMLELIIPEEAAIPRLYLVTDDSDPAGVFRFIKKAKYPWALLNENPVHFMETVSIGDDI